jgi:hypothetical protein
MTSLSEAYGGNVGSATSLRRLYLGGALFGIGVLLALAGIVVGTTTAFVEGSTAAFRFGGILAGIGVPAVFLGVLTVLPASRRTRATAVIGATIAVLGVALFDHAYPCQWITSNCGTGSLTLPTVGLYFFGTATTLWCLFVGIATFKRRNDPGGTARLEVVRQGETVVVESDDSGFGGFGGVGLFGQEPDGDVETQTGSPASDGGSTTQDLSSPLDRSGDTDDPMAPTTDDAEVMRSGAAGDAAERPDVTDRYCGNCDHFQYVRTDDGIQPYCGAHDELMDDMEACRDWQARGGN